MLALQMGSPGGIGFLLFALLWGLVPLAVVALVIYYLYSIDRKLGRLIELQEE